jgi:outer membrane protein assembly factor BamE (lipoprotein component of BamABCDE complex)
MKILQICVVFFTLTASSLLSSCFHVRTIGSAESSSTFDLSHINQNCINKDKSAVRKALGSPSFYNEKGNIWYYSGTVVVESPLGHRVKSQKITKITFTEDGYAKSAEVIISKVNAIRPLKTVTPTKQQKSSSIIKIFNSAKKQNKKPTEKPTNFY